MKQACQAETHTYTHTFMSPACLSAHLGLQGSAAHLWQNLCSGSTHPQPALHRCQGVSAVSREIILQTAVRSLVACSPAATCLNVHCDVQWAGSCISQELSVPPAMNAVSAWHW